MSCQVHLHSLAGGDSNGGGVSLSIFGDMGVTGCVVSVSGTELEENVAGA
jgi:hypothetical protein